MLVADAVSGKLRKSKDVLLAEKIIWDKKNKGPWEVIDGLVRAWAERTPDDFKAFKVHLKETRDGLFDKKFGRTTGNKNFERRLTMVLPQMLIFMIRSVYKAQELPMDRKFYAEFLNRYPFFKVPDKI